MSDEILEYVQSSTGFGAATVASVLEASYKFIEMALRKGDEVKIEKFGKYYAKDMPPRRGRNPRTGEEIDIPAKRKIGFKFSKSFVASVQPDPANPAAQPDAAAPPDPAPVSEASRKVPPPVPEHLTSPKPSKYWYVSVNGETKEVAQSQLPSVATLETPIWSEETGWQLVKNVPSLAHLFTQAA